MSLSKTNHRLGNQGGGPRERRYRPRSRDTPPPSVASFEKSKAVCFWGKESGNLERCSPRSAVPREHERDRPKQSNLHKKQPKRTHRGSARRRSKKVQENKTQK